MNDDAVQIGEKFQKLIEQFKKEFEDDVVKVRYEEDGKLDWKEAELMAFTMESSACAFEIRLAENDEDTVKADQVVVDDNYEKFTDFVNRVNICIAESDQKIREKPCLVYHELYRIWIPARIIDLSLSDRCSYRVFYQEDYPSGHIVLSNNVRISSQRCEDCGNDVPHDHMAEHQDPAIHIAYKLTKVYLAFWLHFKGVVVGVKNRPAKIVDIYQSPRILSFTYRITFTDNNDEGRECSQNIQFEKIKCKVCDQFLRYLEVMDHLNKHMPDADDIDVRKWTQSPLEIFEETFVKPVFEEFSQRIQDASAIVRKENNPSWHHVQVLSLKVSDDGRAFYLIQYSEQNRFNSRKPRNTEWLPAQNIRQKYFMCTFCPPFMYIPLIDYYEHISIHLPTVLNDLEMNL